MHYNTQYGPSDQMTGNHNAVVLVFEVYTS